MNEQVFCQSTKFNLFIKYTLAFVLFHFVNISFKFFTLGVTAIYSDYLLSYDYFEIIPSIAGIVFIFLFYLFQKQCVSYNEDGIRLKKNSLFGSSYQYIQFKEIRIMRNKFLNISFETYDGNITKLDPFFSDEDLKAFTQFISGKIDNEKINPALSKNELLNIVFFITIVIFFLYFMYEVAY
jgi:hypothetical protein